MRVINKDQRLLSVAIVLCLIIEVRLNRAVGRVAVDNVAVAVKRGSTDLVQRCCRNENGAHALMKKFSFGSVATPPSAEINVTTALELAVAGSGHVVAPAGKSAEFPQLMHVAPSVSSRPITWEEERRLTRTCSIAGSGRTTD